jgi:hypothetical protein
VESSAATFSGNGSLCYVCVSMMIRSWVSNESVLCSFSVDSPVDFYIYIYKQSITLNHQNLAERIKYKSAETQVLLRNDQWISHSYVMG